MQRAVLLKSWGTNRSRLFTPVQPLLHNVMMSSNVDVETARGRFEFDVFLKYL